MGRLEKIVVLTVLFLVAVILAVSLNRDEVVAGPKPVVEARLPDPDGQPLAPEKGFQAPDKALSGTLLEPQAPDRGPLGSIPAGAAEPTPKPEVELEPKLNPTPAPVAPRPLLRTTEGLEPSLVPNLMLYTWQAGDNFTVLADRYYGSRLEMGKLRAANEGRDESAIAVGEQVFVPVEPVAPAERLGTVSSQAGQWLGGGVYVVESGDMLGKIAQKTYGSAAKWRRIFEANRDVLASPDALKVGMRLRIPAE